MFVSTWFYALACTTIVLTHASKDILNNTETCAVLYEKGVEAYLENKYEDCVIYFEAALHKYRLYFKKLQNCRMKCKEDATLADPFFPADIEDLHFFEKTIRNTLCILKCKNQDKTLFGKYNINDETEKLFADRKPYEYLHICYFQTKDPQKAASSAFTYLVAHLDDKSMVGNLKYYTTQPEVDVNDVINYEAHDYVYLYVHGSAAYDKKDWKSVEVNMEESLVSYLQTEEECRSQCEGPFDQGWYPDFIPSIANHFTYSLRCKRKCKEKLSNLNGDIQEDLLPTHYHYLQYAYYKLGKVKQSCQAVASYLLFFPGDETMLTNIKYYEKLPDFKEGYLTPRPEAVHYVQREAYEQKLLKFVFTEFIFDNSVDQEKTNQVKIPNIEVTKTAKELHGTQRYLADNFLTKNECNKLIHLARMFAIQGDGYTGNKSPHTSTEKFEGIAISRATFLVKIGLTKADSLKLLLKSTEEVKRHIEGYFKLPNLYFSYTHLVCRSAISGTAENRSNFSHAIHSDNCNLKKNGDCIKAAPSYTWRDYSAILYLNDEFLGGEFIFSSDFDGYIVQSTIKPKCGRMVAFSSGRENLHGVKAVTSGTRCAIGIWFTFDPKYFETDRDVAYNII